MNSESTVKTIVFKGLLRPATTLGVPYQLFVIELIVASVLFISLQSPGAAAAIIPLHIAAYFMLQSDPHIFNVYWVTWFEVNTTRNKKYWGGNSYYS